MSSITSSASANILSYFKKSSAKVVGVDVDAKGLYTGDKDYVITSIMKNLAVTVADILKEVYGFTNTSFFGTGYTGTLSNGGVGFTPVAGTNEEGVTATAEELAKIIAEADTLVPNSCDTTYVATCVS